jgi:hypothetical protein
VIFPVMLDVVPVIDAVAFKSKPKPIADEVVE